MRGDETSSSCGVHYVRCFSNWFCCERALAHDRAIRRCDYDRGWSIVSVFLVFGKASR